MTEHGEHPKKKDSYTITKVTLWQGISAILAIAIVFMWFTGGSPASPGQAAVPTPTAQPSPTPNQQAPPSQPTRLDVSVDDDAMLGDPDAPVTIIEFSDFQCPFCRKTYTETLPQLKKEYIDTGKAKFVYRDFPLSFHQMAQASGEAAECARDQGDDSTYYEYHDKLYDEQGKEGSGTVQYTNNDLVKWAGDIGLDTTVFSECLNSGKFKAEVQADFSEGQQAGVSGTPTFFINGVKIVGAQPFQVLKQVIDAELANS